jgi:hypothetical protein
VTPLSPKKHANDNDITSFFMLIESINVLKNYLIILLTYLLCTFLGLKKCLVYDVCFYTNIRLSI